MLFFLLIYFVVGLASAAIVLGIVATCKDSVDEHPKVRYFTNMKPESKFQQEFGLSLRRVYPDGFWHNIRDIPYKTPKGFIANHRKPFDALFVAPEFSLAIEFKAHRKHTAWPNSLKDHQRKGLEQARRASMLPLVTIQVKFDKVNFAASLDPNDVQGKSMRPEQILEQAKFVHYRRKVNLGDHLETLYDVTQFGETAQLCLT